MSISDITLMKEVKKVIYSGKSISSGMKELCELSMNLIPHPVWVDLSSFLYEDDAKNIGEQIQQLLLSEPPPKEISVFYLGLFEGGNDQGNNMMLYISGSNEFGSNGPTNPDWGFDPPYFPEGRYLNSPVMRNMYRIIKQIDEYMFYVSTVLLFLGYAGLFTANIDKYIPSKSLLGKRTNRFITTGLDAGGWIFVGELSPKELILRSNK